MSETFGPYRLDALIARGGMGEVYRATDLAKNRVVALKRLPRQLAADRDFQVRFRREAEMIAGLREPHVVPIHDYGEIDGQLYVDMRLVEGTDLAKMLASDGPLPPARAVDIIAQVAAALDAAHADGLVHRDVKPSNVLVSPQNHSGDYAYLVDFGIAHSAAATRLTATGSTIGTVAYIAPERLVSDRWDHRVDIYALGCVLSETLTGQQPFPGHDVQAQMFAHVHSPPPQPSRLRAGVALSFDDVVATAMAKNPSHRFPSATALATAARAALGSDGLTPAGRGKPLPAHATVGSGQPSSTPRRGRPRRWRGGVVVIAVAVAGALLFGEQSAPPPVPGAEVARKIAGSEQAQGRGAPQAMTCPADLPAEEGAQLRCMLTDQNQRFGVSVTVTSVQDGAVEYDYVVDALPD